MPNHRYPGRFRSKRGWRGEAGATVMADLAKEYTFTGNVLIVDEYEGIVAQILSKRGVEVYYWYQRALGGRTATSWIPDLLFDTVIIRLPIGREAFEMVLHATAAHLKPQGELFVFGANDEGIRSAIRPMKQLSGTVRTVVTRKHCRVMVADRPDEVKDLHGDRAAWKRNFVMDLPHGPIEIVSYPGVFAHGRLDKGTEFLISSLPSLRGDETVLDFGCGNGVIGAAIRQQCPGVKIHLLDVFALAIEAAKENVPDAQTFVGDGLSTNGLTNYDLIISNPPIHTGKGEDFRVLSQMIERAPSKLRRHGCLMLVAQRTVPVNRLLSEYFNTIDLVSESSQFRVWKAQD